MNKFFILAMSVSFLTCSPFSEAQDRENADAAARNTRTRFVQNLMDTVFIEEIGKIEYYFQAIAWAQKETVLEVLNGLDDDEFKEFLQHLKRKPKPKRGYSYVDIIKAYNFAVGLNPLDNEYSYLVDTLRDYLEIGRDFHNSTGKKRSSAYFVFNILYNRTQDFGPRSFLASAWQESIAGSASLTGMLDPFYLSEESRTLEPERIYATRLMGKPRIPGSAVKIRLDSNSKCALAVKRLMQGQASKP